MKRSSSVALLALSLAVWGPAARAEYSQVNLTVFGMDCAPCAHAIRVAMRGIPGVSTVDVDLNTGLVGVKLAPGNSAELRQFNQAVEKNGFTHKDANVVARGTLGGTAAAPVLTVSRTTDHYALQAASGGQDISALLGKTVVVSGVLPAAPKGKVPEMLRYSSIAEAQ